jgi:hypothetical protein
MRPFLRHLSPKELFAFAALGGEPVRAWVEAELDRRAGMALVWRILRCGRACGCRSAARHRAQPVAAA